MPQDLIAFMRWIGLIDPEPKPVINWGGVWFKDGEVPF